MRGYNMWESIYFSETELRKISPLTTGIFIIWLHDGANVLFVGYGDIRSRLRNLLTDLTLRRYKRKVVYVTYLISNIDNYRNLPRYCRYIQDTYNSFYMEEEFNNFDPIQIRVVWDNFV